LGHATLTTNGDLQREAIPRRSSMPWRSIVPPHLRRGAFPAVRHKLIRASQACFVMVTRNGGDWHGSVIQVAAQLPITGSAHKTSCCRRCGCGRAFSQRRNMGRREAAVRQTLDGPTSPSSWPRLTATRHWRGRQAGPWVAEDIRDPSRAGRANAALKLGGSALVLSLSPQRREANPSGPHDRTDGVGGDNAYRGAVVSSLECPSSHAVIMRTFYVIETESSAERDLVLARAASPFWPAIRGQVIPP